VWPEITQERIRNVAHGLRPCFQDGYVIDANAQNLGIIPRELGEILLVRGHLDRSDRSEGQWYECQDDILLTPKLGERYILVEMGFHGEIRSFFSNFRCVCFLCHMHLEIDVRRQK
jgi:hypothetical protein